MGLHSTLKTLSGPKGYASYIKQYEPTEESIEQADLDEIRTKLVRIHKDNVVDSVLPSLARGLKAMENNKVADQEADDYAEFEKDMDAKKQANTNDIIAFSKSNDDIEILDVPDQVQKLKSELDMIKVKKFDKDEEKNIAQKNRNIVKSVLDYLEVNVADDAMGNAIATLDQDNAEQRAASMRLAMKYLKGKTKKINKAKKDLYGKDKTESEQFENWANTIVEGTWAIPDTVEDVDAIEELMKKPLPLGPDGDDATNAISVGIGDDSLYDDLYAAGEKDPNGDARPIIANWLKKNIMSYPTMPKDLARRLLNIAEGDVDMSEEVQVEDSEEITNTGREEDLSNIDRDSITIDMVKPAIEKMLASYEADAKEWNDNYAEMEKEVRAKGVTDPRQIEIDVFNMDDDIVSYVNIDDLEDKIDAIKRLMKQGDADGHDIVDMASSGPVDTSAREQFMQELKTAIKQDYPDLYDKLFMYGIGESENDAEYTDQLRELRSLAFGLDEDCLLYTSPSPRDLSTSRMPSSA